jgi:uracil-DNA glycosylase
VTPPSGGQDPREAARRFLRQRMELGSARIYLGEAEAGPLLAGVSQPRGAPTPRVQPMQPLQPIRPAEAQPTAPAPAAMASPPAALEIPGDLPALEVVCKACTRCALSGTRSNVVFSDGVPTASVMVVGEAPGANEDASGQPFVGAAGKLLDLLLLTVGLSRKESVYIANVIKCRPPGNRNPLPEEIAACAPYLRAQIAAVRPKVILAVGTFSGQLLTGSSEPLGKLRGRIHLHEGIPLVVTYHPAALLRNGGWTRPTWEDLQQLRRVLSGEEGVS